MRKKKEKSIKNDIQNIKFEKENNNKEKNIKDKEIKNYKEIKQNKVNYNSSLNLINNNTIRLNSNSKGKGKMNMQKKIKKRIIINQK